LSAINCIQRWQNSEKFAKCNSDIIGALLLENGFKLARAVFLENFFFRQSFLNLSNTTGLPDGIFSNQISNFG
jgi:hypothetical protein